MLDLSFGLPLSVRDAALKMVAPGPTSDINREYYAQEHEKEIEDGRGAIEEYDKTDEKARDLLRRLANSQPYYRKQRQLESNEDEKEPERKQIGYGPGPVRTSDSKKAASPVAAGPRKARAVPGARAPQPEDFVPPQDPNIVSLFVTGVEDDLPEHAIRTFFTQFGQLRSLVCSHRSHCAFVNYATREAAESAAAQCQGKAIIQGCPLRVRWGKPKPLDNTDRDQRLEWAKEGRLTAAGAQQKAIGGSAQRGLLEAAPEQDEESNSYVVAAPPGAEQPQYTSLAGD